MSDIRTIATERLLLRQFVLDDIPELHRILTTPGIMRYFPTPSAPDLARTQRIVQHQIDEWRQRGYGWWAVTWAGDATLIGWCGLQYLPDTDETEVGYLLAQPWWGRGLATEAARASVDIGFNHFDFNELIGITHPENTASQNVLKKCGMAFTAATRYFNMDCYRFAIMRSAWDALGHSVAAHSRGRPLSDK